MKKILVIDDNALMRRNLVATLRSGSFIVMEAADGDSGLNLARTESPDLILCDVTMPGKDGYEVLNELRANPKTGVIPFIFLTGKAEKSDFRVGMNLGADDYLPKPITTQDLLAAVAARLKQHEERERYAKAFRNQAATLPDYSSPELLQALGLTRREAEVLLWVAQGKTNPEIAILLGIGHRTVKKHLEHVFTKLGVETRTAATRSALEALMR